jgi:hypothetical protein
MSRQNTPNGAKAHTSAVSPGRPFLRRVSIFSCARVPAPWFVFCDFNLLEFSLFVNLCPQQKNTSNPGWPYGAKRKDVRPHLNLARLLFECRSRHFCVIDGLPSSLACHKVTLLEIPSGLNCCYVIFNRGFVDDDDSMDDVHYYVDEDDEYDDIFGNDFNDEYNEDSDDGDFYGYESDDVDGYMY